VHIVEVVLSDHDVVEDRSRLGRNVSSFRA